MTLRFFSLAILSIVILTSRPVSCQTFDDAYAAVRQYPSIVVPGGSAALSLIGDTLWMGCSDMMFRADRRQGEVVALEADAAMNSYDRRIVYAVQHPVSRHLFISVADRRGQTTLYELIPREGKSPKARRIKLGRLKHDITHPVFSPDGRVMVFSFSTSRRGGSDLWYSVNRDGSWSMPVNMGTRINTFGDEQSPFISGNYLFFASRQREGDNPPTWHIYATQLYATQVKNDTVGMLRIGQADVQELPVVVNNGDGVEDFVYDSRNHAFYWIARHDGQLRLYSAAGTPEGFVLSGSVFSDKLQPVADARVELFANGHYVASTQSDQQGQYKLTMQAGVTYEMRCYADGYFSQSVAINERHLHNDLFQPIQRNIVLKGWTGGQVLTLTNVFGDNGDIQLTEAARSELESVNRYLFDNPQLQARMTLFCRRTNSVQVNTMLNERRLGCLQAFFDEMPSSAQVSFLAGDAAKTVAPSVTPLYDWLVVTFEKIKK